MMVSKAKAPSWPASLPGWERSANMEYAEWALVPAHYQCRHWGWASYCSDLKMASWLEPPTPRMSSIYWEANKGLVLIHCNLQKAFVKLLPTFVHILQ